MSRVYSARLAAGTASGGDTTVYEVPANQKAVVNDVEFLNVGTGFADFVLGAIPAGGSVLPFYASGGAPVGGGDSWRGRLVLNAGDRLVVGTDGEYNYVVSGYLFLV